MESPFANPLQLYTSDEDLQQLLGESLVDPIFLNAGNKNLLEQMPLPVMMPVEGNRVSCQKTLHDPGNGNIPCPDQQVKMIWNQRPGKTCRYVCQFIFLCTSPYTPT
jgi:hypothetical protein